MNKYGLLTLATNVVLVLEGGRLAYRSDQFNLEVHEWLLPEIINLAPELMILPLYKEEPLIIRKENRNRVIQIFNSEPDVEVAWGRVLGFAYLGSGWLAQGRDTYEISYVTFLNNQEVHLYGFSIPISKYSADIRAKVLIGLERNQKILALYGFQVEIEVWERHQGGPPEVILYLTLKYNSEKLTNYNIQYWSSEINFLFLSSY